MDNRITLCGNDCAACGQRYELRCPGCAVRLMSDTLMTMFWLLIGGVVLNMISMLLTSEGGALFMLGTLAAAAILLAGAMVLGAAAALICGLGMIVMSILRFIWLARSAGTFRAELIRRAGVGRCGR